MAIETENLKGLAQAGAPPMRRGSSSSPAADTPTSSRHSRPAKTSRRLRRSQPGRAAGAGTSRLNEGAAVWADIGMAPEQARNRANRIPLLYSDSAPPAEAAGEGFGAVP